MKNNVSVAEWKGKKKVTVQITDYAIGMCEQITKAFTQASPQGS